MTGLTGGGPGWTLADIPDQADRTVLVTGTTVGGLGHFTALELARRGARVILAGRTPAKLDETAATIREEVPDALLEQLRLDLADLASVREAAESAAAYDAIDVLVNNAGIMAPGYQVTSDGFESQIATNHLGPFLFTGLLLDQVVASGDGRVVSVSSQMHRIARQAPVVGAKSRISYRRWPTYGESKLANLLFTFELDRRVRAAGLPVRALAAHPGFAGTHLMANGQFGRATGGPASILDAATRAISQPAHAGAWPSLMAATSDLPGSTYVGPSGPGQMTGSPQIVTARALARNEAVQRNLWEESEAAVGLQWP